MLNAQEYPYKSLVKYPGMRPRDVVIWENFITSYPRAFDRVWYNIHIGDPTKNVEEMKRMKESGAWDVQQWLIDVFAETATHYYLIEVKPNAMAGALGQAYFYRQLLLNKYTLDKPIQSAVLTDSISPITKQAAILGGVALFTP